MKFIQIKDWLFNYDDIQSIKRDIDEGIAYLYVYVKGDDLCTEIENATFNDIEIYEVK